MHIAIDARFFGPKQGGIGRYVEELVREINNIKNSKDQYTVLLKSGVEIPFVLNSHIKTVYTKIHWYSIKEQLFLPFVYRRIKADMWHFPHFNVPLFASRPFIVTCHDIIMFKFSRHESSTHSRFVYSVIKQCAYWVAQIALKRADHVIVTTKTVSNDVGDFFGIDKQKMTVVYQAPGRFDDSLETFNKITQPYALYVGAAFPHKNLDRLLLAWNLALPNLPNNAILALSGPESFFYNRLRGLNVLKHRVLFLGHVSDNEMRALYAGAHFFIFPSLSEGFGIPPLEAMSLGVPVIASNIFCLREVLGDAADFFNPYDESDIAKSIVGMWNNSEKRRNFIEKGRVQVSKYSWGSLLKQTLEIYSKVMNKN